MMRTQWPNETMVTNEVDVKNLDEKDILLRILDRMDKAVSLLSIIADEEVD